MNADGLLIMLEMWGFTCASDIHGEVGLECKWVGRKEAQEKSDRKSRKPSRLRPTTPAGIEQGEKIKERLGCPEGLGLPLPVE